MNGRGVSRVWRLLCERRPRARLALTALYLSAFAMPWAYAIATVALVILIGEIMAALWGLEDRRKKPEPTIPNNRIFYFN